MTRSVKNRLFAFAPRIMDVWAMERGTKIHRGVSSIKINIIAMQSKFLATFLKSEITFLFFPIIRFSTWTFLFKHWGKGSGIWYYLFMAFKKWLESLSNSNWSQIIKYSYIIHQRAHLPKVFILWKCSLFALNKSKKHLDIWLVGNYIFDFDTIYFFHTDI